VLVTAAAGVPTGVPQAPEEYTTESNIVNVPAPFLWSPITKRVPELRLKVWFDWQELTIVESMTTGVPKSAVHDDPESVFLARAAASQPVRVKSQNDDLSTGKSLESEVVPAPLGELGDPPDDPVAASAFVFVQFAPSVERAWQVCKPTLPCAQLVIR
jgi:hypothetical protein